MLRTPPALHAPISSASRPFVFKWIVQMRSRLGTCGSAFMGGWVDGWMGVDRFKAGTNCSLSASLSPRSSQVKSSKSLLRADWHYCTLRYARFYPEYLYARQQAWRQARRQARTQYKVQLPSRLVVIFYERDRVESTRLDLNWRCVAKKRRFQRVKCSVVLAMIGPERAIMFTSMSGVWLFLGRESIDHRS